LAVIRRARGGLIGVEQGRAYGADLIDLAMDGKSMDSLSKPDYVKGCYDALEKLA
jgi:hypothetical protein